MAKKYIINLQVEVTTGKDRDGKKIPEFHFRGWKYGIMDKDNQFINESFLKKTKGNTQIIGEAVFKAAREMHYGE